MSDPRSDPVFGFAQGAPQPGDATRENSTLVLCGVRVAGGADLRVACLEAIGLSTRLRVGVRIVFNGTSITAWPDSKVEQLVADWQRANGSPPGAPT